MRRGGSSRLPLGGAHSCSSSCRAWASVGDSGAGSLGVSGAAGEGGDGGGGGDAGFWGLAGSSIPQPSSGPSRTSSIARVWVTDCPGSSAGFGVNPGRERAERLDWPLSRGVCWGKDPGPQALLPQAREPRSQPLLLPACRSPGPSPAVFPKPPAPVSPDISPGEGCDQGVNARARFSNEAHPPR